MRVAGVQLDIVWEDPAANLARSAALVAAAAAQGARLVALPEMFATGFSRRLETTLPHADAILAHLGALARRHGVWLLGGLAAPHGEGAANLAVLVDPNGREAGRYAKIHPFGLAGEDRCHRPGDRLVTVTVEGVRVTPLVCYDLRFPELVRAAAAATDLFVFIANWPVRRSHAWRTLLQARAIDGLAWVLGVNRVGEAEGHPHRGDSALNDPFGETVASLAWQEGIVVGDVDPETVERTRATLRFLDERRPEVYARLGE